MTPLLTLLLAVLPAELGDAPPAVPVDYVRDVKPILAQNCVKCHGPDKRRNGLRLDTAAGARKGGESGPAVVPGDSAKSRIILAVTGADGVKPMPPSGTPLGAAQVAVLKAWIDAGAPPPPTRSPPGASTGRSSRSSAPPSRP